MANLNVEEWTPEQVEEWMSGLEGAAASHAWRAAAGGLTGRRLLLLGPHCLDTLGVTAIGHQELILEAVDRLREFQYESRRECVSSLSLALSAAGRSLSLVQCGSGSGSGSGTCGRLDCEALASTGRAVRAAKALCARLAAWASPPAPLPPRPASALLALALEAATCAQRDRFAESPAVSVLACARALSCAAECVLRELHDPAALTPSTLVSLNVRQPTNRANRPRGSISVRSGTGGALVARVALGSAVGTLLPGDELIAVNNRVVVGWSAAQAERLCGAAGAAAAAGGQELCLRLRRHARPPPQHRRPRNRAMTELEPEPRLEPGDPAASSDESGGTGGPGGRADGARAPRPRPRRHSVCGACAPPAPPAAPAPAPQPPPLPPTPRDGGVRGRLDKSRSTPPYRSPRPAERAESESPQQPDTLQSQSQSQQCMPVGVAVGVAVPVRRAPPPPSPSPAPKPTPPHPLHPQPTSKVTLALTPDQKQTQKQTQTMHKGWPQLSPQAESPSPSLALPPLMALEHMTVGGAAGGTLSLKKTSVIVSRGRGVPAGWLLSAGGAGGAAGGAWQRVRPRGGRGRWARRHLVLAAGALYAYRVASSPRATLRVRLGGCTAAEATEVRSRQYAFKVYHTGHVLYFAAPTHGDMLLWLQLITRQTLAAAAPASAQLEPNAQFSETEYSDTESDPESGPAGDGGRRGDGGDESPRGFRGDLVGSWLAGLAGLARSESADSVRLGDAKYLRFFPRGARKRDKHDKKKKQLPPAVLVPVRPPPSPSSPALPPVTPLAPESPQSPPSRSSLSSRGRPPAPQGFVTLEEFMLKKQEEERKQGCSARAACGSSCGPLGPGGSLPRLRGDTALGARVDTAHRARGDMDGYRQLVYHGTHTGGDADAHSSACDGNGASSAARFRLLAAIAASSVTGGSGKKQRRGESTVAVKSSCVVYPALQRSPPLQLESLCRGPPPPRHPPRD